MNVRPGVIFTSAMVAAVSLHVYTMPAAPQAWNPRPAPALTGHFARNDALRQIARLCTDECDGPETIAISGDAIFSGARDGRIVQTSLATGISRTVGTTGGRPLGVAIANPETILIADAQKGLLSLTVATGRVVVLATEHAGKPFRFLDDLDVAPDGTIYFSDASTEHGLETATVELVEHLPRGRLLAYDPSSQETRVVADGLYLANGVAVARDGSFVLVCETAAYRVTRQWLTGPRAGTRDIFIDNLPGFPDGISTGASGAFWIALYAPRSSILDGTAPYPWARKALLRLPEWMQPQPSRHAFVLGVDVKGNVTANLQHEAGDAYAPITSVEEAGGGLFFGSISLNGFARLPVSHISVLRSGYSTNL